MPPVLREATAADGAAADRLAREGFESYRAFGLPGYEPPAEPESFAARLAAEGAWGVVAEEHGDVVGVGAFEQAREPPRLGPHVEGLAHVWAIFVTESRWGTGVAGALLRAVTAEIGRRGYGEARLFTPAAHARARRFYAREGWAERGEPVPVPELRLDMVELRRAL